MRIAFAVLTAAVIFGGCAGGSAETEATRGPAPPPTFDAATGAIEGTVIDDENVPIPDAQVALVGHPANTTTDAAGAFTLSNVPPGAYTLAAAKLGFDSAVRKVTVNAGEVASTTMILSALAIESSHMQLDQYTGHLDWGVRITPAVGGYADGDIVHEFNTTDRTDAIEGFLVEMNWQDTQALAGGMRLRVEVEGEANELDYTFCVIDSRPPGRCDGTDNVTKVLDNGHGDCDEEECKLQWRGFTSTRGTGLPADFGLMLDQDFTVWVSLFYRETIPPDYSAMPDS